MSIDGRTRTFPHADSAAVESTRSVEQPAARLRGYPAPCPEEESSRMSTVIEPGVHVEPAVGPAGAEIRGVDLARPPTEEVHRVIEDALHRHVVIFFRNQRITPEQHIAFSRRFGPLEIHVLHQYMLPGHPEILVLSNVLDEAGRQIGLPDAGHTWHTDTSYRAKPSRSSVLYAHEIPHADDGTPLGDTRWANTAAAYDALPQDMKLRLEGLKAIHRYGSRARRGVSPRARLTAEQQAMTPDVVHPVVRTHPYTGRKALYVFEGECVGIEGMPEDEALALFRSLQAHCIEERFIYRHRWQVGDIVMWDNCQSLHLATSDYRLPKRRLLHRTTIEGGVPF